MSLPNSENQLTYDQWSDQIDGDGRCDYVRAHRSSDIYLAYYGKLLLPDVLL